MTRKELLALSPKEAEMKFPTLKHPYEVIHAKELVAKYESEKPCRLCTYCGANNKSACGRYLTQVHFDKSCFVQAPDYLLRRRGIIRTASNSMKSQRLRDCAFQAGHTASTLSTATGICYERASAMWDGVMNITFHSAVKFAAVIDVDPEYLYGTTNIIGKYDEKKWEEELNRKGHYENFKKERSPQIKHRRPGALDPL